MILEKLSKFCLDNAGKIASGEDKDGKKHSGRILSYAPSKSGGWIILEDTRLGKKQLPNPLPNTPHLDNKWYCVITDCHLGYACLADSVKLVVEAKISTPPTITPAPVKATTYKCGHEKCVDGFCVPLYCGFI